MNLWRNLVLIQNVADLRNEIAKNMQRELKKCFGFSY